MRERIRSPIGAIGAAIPAASFHRAEAELALARARDVITDVRKRMPEAAG